jgi:hypothetical protein
MMQRLDAIPGMRWVVRHPRLAGWFALSVGMIALLVIEANDVGLLTTQWGALIIATILVAGLCVWIISWEDNNTAAPVTTEPPTNPNLESNIPTESIPPVTASPAPAPSDSAPDTAT